MKLFWIKIKRERKKIGFFRGSWPATPFSLEPSFHRLSIPVKLIHSKTTSKPVLSLLQQWRPSCRKSKISKMRYYPCSIYVLSYFHLYSYLVYRIGNSSRTLETSLCLRKIIINLSNRVYLHDFVLVHSGIINRCDLFTVISKSLLWLILIP